MSVVKNEKQLPTVMYGLHFCEGVAEYQEPQVNEGQPYRILLNESTIKNMDASFAGRPVFVKHVDEVNLDTLKNDADGYVMESFYNKNDGKHWVKFIVVSDEGHEALRKGWKLSNAYVIKGTTGGGNWHGVEYIKEVTNAEYEHLAIVPNPRYEESIVLTPEEFKEYNNKKEIELKKLYNSKTQEKLSMFESFKKKLISVINEADESQEKKEEKPEAKKEEMNEDMMANGDHHVMIGDEKMKVNDLIAKHEALKKENGELKAKHYDDLDKKEEPAKEEDKKEDSSDDEEAKKKALAIAEHEDKEIEAEKESKKNNFDKLKNAHGFEQSTKVDLSEDKVARGKSRYGSGK